MTREKNTLVTLQDGGIVEGFDWVTARAQCSLGVVFEKLRLQVEEDVRITNLRLTDHRDHFQVVGNEDHFSVILPSNPLHPKVKFSVDNEKISVRDGKEKPMCEATLTLNNDGECMIKIDEQEYELWQMRKLVLEDMFFKGR